MCGGNPEYYENRDTLQEHIAEVQKRRAALRESHSRIAVEVNPVLLYIEAALIEVAKRLNEEKTKRKSGCCTCCGGSRS